MSQPSVNLEEILNTQGSEMKMRLITGQKGLSRFIDHARIQKPSLAFTGFLEHLSDFRLQVIGQTELHYLETRSTEEQQRVINNFFDLRVAAVIVTRGIIPPESIIQAAAKTDTPLFISELTSSDFMTNMTLYLSKRLAPVVSFHGVFMDIFGQGVILSGKSGIGKSEIALELITRGHRLIADDCIQLFHEAPNTLVGRCPKSLVDHLEVRGLGFINVRELFGSAAITQSKRATLIANFIKLDGPSNLLRAKRENDQETINGVTLPSVVIPILPGRSMAVLVEVATRNQSLRNRGVDSNKDFMDAMDARIHKK